MILCIFSSGCAASMQSNKVGISPDIPNTPVTTEDNLIPQDDNLVLADLDKLMDFIGSYNKRLNENEVKIVANSILEASNIYKVDYRIITALVAIESGFNSKARSPSGALGLGQLMPRTASSLMVKNPFDPLDNLNGTVKLLRTYLEKYEGNINYALAAYKMGCGAVARSGISQPSTANYIKNIRKIFDNIP